MPMQNNITSRLISIDTSTRYLPASENPLSSDVIFVRGKSSLWVYDVGASKSAYDTILAVADSIRNKPENLEFYSTNPLPIKLVISHFHPDHITNLARFFDFDEQEMPALYDRRKYQISLFVGPNTIRYTKGGTIVDKVVNLTDGAPIRIFPVPSSHAKGCLGMEISGKTTFLGDALYPGTKDGKQYYNAQYLKETINTLNQISTANVFISHLKKPVKPLAMVINSLQDIYDQRNPQRPLIQVNSPHIFD